MQDGIIAGNGNSRYLKTVAAALSLYPDYESFMAALIAGTFPIDFNGINASGWVQQGTPLNKANLFSDTTASALGLTASNTPNDALAKLKQLIDSSNSNANTRAKIATGSYIGSVSPKTSGSGQTTKTITLGFRPSLFILNLTLFDLSLSMVFTQQSLKSAMIIGNTVQATILSNGITLNGSVQNIDHSSYTYVWIAIG